MGILTLWFTQPVKSSRVNHVLQPQADTGFYGYPKRA